MTIAVPIMHNRVSPVLDTAARLLLVRRHHGKELARREFVLDMLPTEALATMVAELHVDVLLCAAVSEPLLRALEARGVRVEPHICGGVDEVLQAFCAGRLGAPEFRMPGCWGRMHGWGCCRRHRARRGHGAAKDITPPKPEQNQGLH